MTLTNYLESAFLGHLIRDPEWLPPTNLFLGLFTVIPTDLTPGTECPGDGYQRQEILFGDVVVGSVSNSSVVTFPPATGGNWGTIVAVGLFDDQVSGTLLWYGPTDDPIIVADTDEVEFGIGDIDLSID